MLCTVCLGVLQKLEGHISQDNGELILLHHSRATALKTAAETGCRVCYAFWNQLSVEQQAFLEASDEQFPLPAEDIDIPDVKRDDDESWSARAKLIGPCCILAMVSRAELMLKEIDKGSILFCPMVNPDRRIPETVGTQTHGMFLLQPTTESMAAEIQQNNSNEYERNTASATTWQVVEQWLGQCLETHERCSHLREQTWYPTRLLDLQHREESVQLIDSNGEHISGRYMTLSHRWGQSNPLSLCRATIHSMKQGIPISTLPQAFQDAVLICKRLGVRYIWIDSLCIMQDKDDLSDWVREAALMHKVYSYSHLNISSLAAVDSSYSLFADREPSLLNSTTLSTFLDGEKLSERETTYGVIDMLFWERQMNFSHLNLRAWVMQERLLAPRVVHFGPQQVLWECHEFDAAESCRHGLPEATNVLRSVVRFKDLMSESGGPRSQRESLGSAPYGVWTRIVRAYSKCGLAVKEDKLIALAGITKQMAVQLDDKYVAGMWGRSLPWEITWKVDRPDKRSASSPRRAVKYRAPSFSWASIDGPVSPATIGGGRPLTQILDVSLEYITDDTTGLVKSGSLLLECQLQKLSLRRNSIATLEHLCFMTINGVDIRLPSGEEWEMIGPVVTLDEDMDDLTKSDDLYCMPALIWDDEKPMLTSLLLELDCREEATYRRIGVANSLKQQEIEMMLQEDVNAASLPALSYKSGKHTIRLI